MSNRIKEIRRARGLSMEQLADRVGCATPQINKLEKAERRLSLDWMRKLARALEVAPADLLSREDNPARYDEMILSAEERELIEAYRRVPRRNRARILRMMLLMLNEYRRGDAA